jgi:tyrosyl-tRNA synthetase
MLGFIALFVRLAAGKRVSLRELMYPLMQGYDSVAIKADVELGGTDQKFNVLAGRTIQRFYDQEPQDVMTLSLLEGTDGRKMSSSWGNVINLLDTPEDMVGKIMRVEDQLLEKYFTLATRIPLPDIKKIMKSSKNPRDIKLQLASEIVALYHGKAKAAAAVKGFIAQFSNNELPADIELKKMEPGMYALSELLALHGLAASKSEARRLIAQKGVKVNQKTVSDETVVVDGKVKHLLQVGKRRFLYIQ